MNIKNNFLLICVFLISFERCLSVDENLVQALELASKLSQKKSFDSSEQKQVGGLFNILFEWIKQFKSLFKNNSGVDLVKRFSFTKYAVNDFSQRKQAVDYRGPFKTLSEWIKQFEKLLKNRKGAHPLQHSGFAGCGDKNKQWLEFSYVLNEWLSMQSSGSLSIEKNWLLGNNGKTKPDKDFFDPTEPCEFAPFAQKLIAQPGDSFYLHGDLHGDIFSLLEELKDLKTKGVLDDNFRIIPDNVWLVFLGDYVDRGQYGNEVLYTMMRLALANPDRVIAVRGNHEDITISSRYGFKNEVHDKFDDIDGSKHKYISRMNDFLPVVFYLGCEDSGTKIINYIQCCHGGVEEAYDPKLFLDNQITQYQLLGILSSRHSDVRPFESGKVPNGFMWNDFDVKNRVDSKYFDPSRGYVYGQKGTEEVLQDKQSSAKSKIRGIMRAHQHADSDMMQGIIESKGVYKLWEPCEKIPLRKLDKGLVWTFNVGADTEYGQRYGFDFDTYAKVTTQKKYQDWTMEVFNTKVL